MVGSILIKSPRQATTVYGLQGHSPPRQKGSFYVRFVRTSGPQNVNGWQNDLGFFVKTIDRPTIEPQIETLNQYNKKRQITTSYKNTPIHVTLYDTADSLVMNMWNDYSRYYFGDFNQDDNGGIGPPANYRYDVTLPTFNDSGSGFGYQPQKTGDEVLDLNSQFFFDTIEVYQVYGKEYTQYTLVNPKIMSFVPDDQDYSSSEISTISMTIGYEAVLYRNNAQPQPLNQNADLMAAFSNQFNGETVPVVGAPQKNSSLINTPSITAPLPLTGTGLTALPTLSSNSGNTIGGGALASFGNYIFGALTNTSPLISGIAGDLAYKATGNPALSSILSQAVGALPIPSQLTSSAPQSISGAIYDVAAGALNSLGGSSSFAKSYISSNITSGVMASANLDNNSVNDQITPGDGLALAEQAYGIINAQRPSTSQIGINTDGLTTV